MIDLRYTINGARFGRIYPDTEYSRMLAWSRASVLIASGVQVFIRQSGRRSVAGTAA